MAVANSPDDTADDGDDEFELPKTLRLKNITDTKREALNLLYEEPDRRALWYTDRLGVNESYIAQLKSENRDVVVSRDDPESHAGGAAHQLYRLTDAARRALVDEGVIDENPVAEMANSAEEPSQQFEKGNVSVTGSIDARTDPVQAIADRPRKTSREAPANIPEDVFNDYNDLQSWLKDRGFEDAVAAAGAPLGQTSMAALHDAVVAIFGDGDPGAPDASYAPSEAEEAEAEEAEPAPAAEAEEIASEAADEIATDEPPADDPTESPDDPTDPTTAIRTHTALLPTDTAFTLVRTAEESVARELFDQLVTDDE